MLFKVMSRIFEIIIIDYYLFLYFCLLTTKTQTKQKKRQNRYRTTESQHK